MVLRQLPTRELETLRPTGLSAMEPGARFFVIHGDGTDQFTLDGLAMEWPRKSIKGRGLLDLAGLGPEHEVLLQRENEPDKVIGPDDEVELDAKGVERMVTRLRRVTIAVNARPKTVPLQPISFDALIRLAFENPPSGDGVQFTVQYTRGPEGHASGSLVEGQTVMVRERMEFDVTSTNRS